MRASIALVLMLGITGCATTKPAGGPAAPTAFQPVCLPCAQPCTPETSCAQPKVAVAPAPQPPPPAPAPVVEPAATPSFRPAPGSFTSPQQVTISSATPGAEIRCTTDGTTPTASSPICAGPMTVDRNTTLLAIATKPGAPASAVATGTYAIQPPPPETPRVVVTTQKLELKDVVYFDTGKATIKPQSYGLLDEVAQALKNHEEVKKVSIDGHTDSTGKAKANQKLSQARAEAIRAYLVQKGIEPTRLEAKGFGQTKPIASNKTKAGREKNRRVEFNVVSM